ncbi:hypothetical protein MT158_004127 [Salmonella bongori]|uniref:Uncharacterized protein n=4 Tax=Salmonella bongori TaxID=54736 RepID=S5N0D5_SALBN|nr:hypothetical protein [Salmonella bongori]AGR60324.1 hypothetical protein A464_3140 [Salmonella bongori N268-08]ASG53477.1 hypothetical protein LFZ56_03795 [Salmonella bongori serovar 66:z41:- str. SA19983605]ECC8732460.1 hypothetical protein [Salmonella bongori]ECE6548970.1 hypothetical protein [Salmonella bongori]ECI3520803.1 hypothetical protein [Salmonella bongori]
MFLLVLFLFSGVIIPGLIVSGTGIWLLLKHLADFYPSLYRDAASAKSGAGAGTLKYKTPDDVHQAFYRQKTVNLYQD